ncbi:MAG: FAD-dependent oxidoreductase, partial [Syntrophales bacterium]|nr:FAD-dependent oxidoreductase [Syntrophales bacterium]
IIEGLPGLSAGGSTPVVIVTSPALLPPAAVPASWDYEADVIVVGGGGAGMAAAVSAGEKGAQVIVLEKNPGCGGDTATAMTMISRTKNSKLHKRLGIEPIPLSQVFPMASASFSNKNNGEVERLLLEKDPETADWLEELGVIYETGPAAGTPPGMFLTPINPEKPEDGYYPWFPYNAKGFIRVLEKRARELGVQILKQTPATALVSQKGAVIGVAAKTKDGKTLHIKGKVSVLASGGFGANKAMLKKYVSPSMFSAIVNYIGLPSSTGDGIRMAQGVNAIVEGMDDVEMWDGGVTGVGEGPMAFYNAATQLVRQKSLSVNKLGKRFMDENLMFGHGHEIGPFKANALQTARQKDHTSFTIHDSETVKKDFIINKFEAIACKYPCRWYERDFERRVKDGAIMKAGTIKDLAGLMEIDPTILQETVDQYNRYCDKGEDPEFFKPANYLIPLRKPPFYAVKQVGGALFNTWGGLVTNTKFQVLDKDWNPIAGLRVAGENAAYCASVVYALTSGRIAGEEAAKEARGELRGIF